MAVTSNTGTVTPVVGSEITVATIAGGPFDNISAFVKGGTSGDALSQLTYRLYAVVGALTVAVAETTVQGSNTATILQWQIPGSGAGTQQIVDTGGTSYILKVAALPTTPQPRNPVTGTLAGVNDGDEAADTTASTTLSVPAFSEVSSANINGFCQLIDVSLDQTGLPQSTTIIIYANNGGGSVEAAVKSVMLSGPDGITAILRQVALPVASVYRVGVRNNTGVTLSVPIGFATYANNGGGGGGVVALTGNTNGPSNANHVESFQIESTDANVVAAQFAPITAGIWYVGMNGLTVNRSVVLANLPLGSTITVKDEDGSLAAFNITVTAQDASTIDGAASYVLSAAQNGRQGAVTFERINPGSGLQWAVQVTYQANAFETVSVKEFGAKGDGVADDTAAIQRAVNTLAGLGIATWFPAGTYKLGSPVGVPSNIELKMTGATTILGAMVPSGSNDQAFFVQDVALGGSTTLAAQATVGTTSISVNGTVGGTITAGADIIIASLTVPFHVCIRKVISVAGVGPFTVVFDRALRDTYPINSPVTVIVSRPQNIMINANGATFTGTATRMIELAYASNCHISGVIANNSQGFTTDLTMSFDNASYDCSYTDCSIEGDGAALAGFAFETNEGSTATRCTATRCASGFALYDCFGVELDECEGSHNVIGCYLTGDGNTVGGEGNVISGFFGGNANQGVFVEYGSNETLRNVTVLGNGTSGIEIGAGAPGTMMYRILAGDSSGGLAVGITNHVYVYADGVTLRNGSVGWSALSDVDVDGLVVTGTWVNYAVASNTTFRASHVSMTTTSGPINLWLINSGEVHVDNGNFQAGAASNIFNNSGVLVLNRVRAAVGGGGIGVVLTAGTAYISVDCDLTACSNPLFGGVGSAVVTQRFSGAAAAGGGTFVINIPVPTDTLFYGRAQMAATGITAGHAADGAGLVADVGVLNNNGVLSNPAVVAGSANPSNSANLLTATAEFCTANLRSGGGAPMTAAWTIAGANAVLTITNPSAFGVVANCKVLVSYQIAGF